ncbi:MAG: SAM-dependent methyltransferase, partial [Peptoniphilus senegalensis]
MKQLHFSDDKKIKADYKNWVPKSLVKSLIFTSLVAFILFIALGVSDLVFSGRTRLICALIFGLATLILIFFASWIGLLHRTFDYNGKRKLAKIIIEKTAAYIKIPDGGVGLDIGCGSG